MRRNSTVSKISLDRSGRKHRGFTLVELIVVLVILAILASIAVAGVAGYIKKSRYEQNTQNAITVYQAAQTAISQKYANGSLDSWTRKLVKGSNRLDTEDLNAVNDSIHAAFYYTYNPGDEDNDLYDLLYTYFYDQSIFSGTMTVVFDVSISRDSLDDYIYSASVIGAFYSSQNPDSSNKNIAGWDRSYIDINKGNGDIAPWNELPCTDPVTRRSKSYVGYFDGTEGSIYVPNQLIGPVVLPMAASFELEGHIMGPTVDGTEATGYLFNLRNGETLDVSWAIFDEDYNLEATGNYLGEPSSHIDHEENISILLRNMDEAYQEDVKAEDVRLNITSEKLNAVNWSNTSRTSFEDTDKFNIKRVSWDGFVDVNVKHGQKDLGTYSFPITRSLITGDGRTGCPNPQYGYYEYRLSLDCMMVRSDESDNKELSSRYRIPRLFEQALYNDNDQDHKPYNIYAVLLPESNWTYYPSLNTPSSRTGISATYAARAIDDPVYYTGTSGKADGIHYSYHVKDNAAKYDDPDSYSGEENKYKVTGRCVVNTLFGDANYSTDPVTKKSIGGTTLTLNGSSVANVDAVITSYRHLYNIRGISKNATATFRIVKDLDWYVHKTVVVDGDKTDYYSSEVKVYSRNKDFNSPVSNSGSLQVVSFPALWELKAGSTLTSLSKSSLNNVQMRLASFRLGTDAGYGLICKNSGTIVDIYTNNLNLALAGCADGGNDLDSEIFVDSILITSQKSGSGDLSKNTNDKPIGGLVGLNTATGVIGQDNGSIVMSNSVVMCNHYWNIYGDVNKVATGGVVGKNESSLLGSIEINGAFAVVGRDNVGGVIGSSTADVGARLLVNYSEAPEAPFTLPSYDNSVLGGNHMSSVIISKNCVGAAIGQLTGAALTASDNPFTYSSTPENGVFSNDVDRDSFQVDVTLNAESLIYMLGTYNSGNDNEKVAAGGAIGFMNTANGTSASIRVRNSGNIIVNDTGSNIYCGGVVGRDYKCSTTNVYIDFDNTTGRIGYFSDSTGPVATGGAYGHIQSSIAGRTISIKGANGGTLVSRGNNDGQGTGGAIGGVSRTDGTGVSIAFKINVENRTSSRIIGNGIEQNNANGTGGAIGAMGNKDANEGSAISSDSIIRVVNEGEITGQHHVGGTVGNSVANYGLLYAVDKGSIKGKSYTGGVVGRNDYSNFGEIQAVLLEGASIEGGNYVGGAVGKLNAQYDNALVKTRVSGSSEIIGVNAGSSYVGGVCGQAVMKGTAINGIFELEGDGSTPTLKVEGAGSQVGGAVGQLYADNADNNAIVKTPSQNPGNRLVLKVSGVNDVGGVVGKLNDNDKSKNINVDLSIMFLPGSYVEGRGNNVGGAVGFLVNKDGKHNYSGKISVASVADSTLSDDCYIKGTNNVGGAVGQLYSCTYNSNEFGVISVDFRYLKCLIEATTLTSDSNAGGAIGYHGSNSGEGASSTALPIIVMLGDSRIIAQGNNVGGAVGYNTAKIGTVSLSASGSTIQGKNHVGGAIGYNKEITNCSVGDIIVEITNGSITGIGELGGAIGYNRAASIGKITATFTGKVNGSGNNIGGVIGYNSTSLTKAIVGKMTGSVVGYSNIGGVIGYNDANISTMVNGTISGTVEGKSDNVAGGIGHTTNNTVSGDVAIIFTVVSNARENKVEGANNVGGIIGYNEGTAFSSSKGISSNIPAGFSIAGSGSVGGVVGKNGGALTTVQSVIVSGANVLGSADNVGGAIGENNAQVTNIIVSSNGEIKGSGKVGGAIGNNKGTIDSAQVTMEGKVIGTGSTGEVGGAIGYNEASINGYTDPEGKTIAITVDLKGEIFAGIRDDKDGLSSVFNNVGGAIGHTKEKSFSGDIIVNFSGSAKVEGGNDVGGIIGFDEGTNISGTLSSLLPVKCMVKGYGTDGCVGGVIGKLTGVKNGKLKSVISNINGDVVSAGGYVGGAIGYVYYSDSDSNSNFDIELVKVTMTGLVEGKGSDVGGAIGHLESAKKQVNFKSIETNLQGTAKVHGGDNVGGALGYTECNIESVLSEITGKSVVIGNNCVGGAIGLARAHKGEAGNNIFNLSNNNCSGRIESVKAVISADYALSGTTCVGGAVGQSGDKKSASEFYSAVLLDVQCEINARYLFNPTETGADDPAGMSCIGGVIGRIGEGRVESITLGGTGGACIINAEIFGDDYPYEGPNVSYVNTVLIAAKGRSVGGIVGQLGMSESINASSAQNVTVSKMSVADNGPMLCVVSVNGADMIGGWIGCGLGSSGGFGNRSEKDYEDEGKRATFEVDNVKLVYSTGSKVGGFCGYSRTYDNNTTIPATFADVTVSLNDANIIGKTAVGGAFGYIYRLYLKKGQITVNLNGRTNIGDISGNSMPDDTNSYSSICYEAGGAIGRFDTSKDAFSAPVTVSFNGSLSRVYAGGGSGYQGDYGVGGVIGSLVNNTHGFSADARIILEPSSGEESSSSEFMVYSNNSNAGGSIGYINNSPMDKYTSTKDCYANNIIVQGEANGGAVGGFVGKVTNNKDKKIKYCHFDGTVIAGDNTYAGGFVGYAYNMGTNSYIESCYTTAIVNSTGSAAGGFVGFFDNNGTITNCYVGGHTYQGQYVASDGNINGVGSVGGFVGYTSGTNKFEACYTTASVYGTGSNVGGFVGNRSDNSTLTDCYCTGSVNGSVNDGAFAGSSQNTNYTRCYALDGINDSMPLIGSLSIEGNNDTLNYADATLINKKGKPSDSVKPYAALPFDSSLLGEDYPLRAVINNTHVGDWGVPVDSDKLSIVNADITLINDSFNYKKNGVTLGESDISVTLYDKDGNQVTLKYGEDFTLSYRNNTSAGKATVIIAGVPEKGYTGVVSRDFTIRKVNIKDASVMITGKEYNDYGIPLYDYTGSANVPTIEVKINGDTLTLNKDYYLTYDNNSIDGEGDNNNIDLGTVTVTVHGIGDLRTGNYIGSADAKGTFIIQGMEIKKEHISLSGNTAAELIYDGTEKKPGVIVRIGGQTRTEGIDYTVEYENNINVGTATIKIHGQGILRGDPEETFEITTADNTWVKIPSINGWNWNWYESDNQVPDGDARFGTVEYLYYVDANCATLTDTANSGAETTGGQPVNAGTYYLKAFVDRYEDEDADGYVGLTIDENGVKHYNYYYMEKIIEFTIAPFNISSVSELTIDPDEYCVTGSAIKPSPSDITVIAHSGELEQELVYGDDFTVRYINNINVGEAGIIVEGTGNYTGTCRGTFTIRQPIVVFDSCGGTEIDSSGTSIVYGQRVTRPVDPTRDSETEEYSWRFDGWYDNEDYEGEPYNFNSAVKGDLTLYAKWVKQYYVTFCVTTDESVDNPPSAKTILVDEGSSVAAPSDIKWEGLTLEGWYKNDPLVPEDPEADPSETGLYDFDTPVNENMTLYAKWQAKISFVIVDKKTNEQDPEAVTVDYNSILEEDQIHSIIEIRIRENESGKWIYDGWFLDEECKKPFDPSVAITHDITLYTKWTKVFEAKFIVSDSENYSIPVYMGHSVPVQTAPESDVYSGELYVFDGWFTDAACTDPVDFSASLVADTVYYAKWTEKEYTLSFDANGGTGTMDAVPVTSVTEVAIPSNKYTKEGFVFVGWSTVQDATEAMYTDNDLIALDKDTLLYAVWIEASGG